MNIHRAKSLIRAAFNTGVRRANLRHGNAEQRKAGDRVEQAFLAELKERTADTETPDWQEADSIRNIDTVDEALRDFTDDPTADAATILVQTIIAAYLKG